MSKERIILTDEQRKSLERLWFIFGNSGSKSTKANHTFIQGFLEHGEDRREAIFSAPLDEIKSRFPSTWQQWVLTEECVAEVDKILKSDGTERSNNS